MSQKQTPDSALPPSSSMVFTLEDDNHAAPVYETRIQEWETAPHDWQEEDDDEYEDNEMIQRTNNNIIDHVQSTENAEVENIPSVSKDNFSSSEKNESISAVDTMPQAEEHIEQPPLTANMGEEHNESSTLSENVAVREDNAVIDKVDETADKVEEIEKSITNQEELVTDQLDHSILEKAIEAFKLPDVASDSVAELPPVDDDHDFKMDAEEPNESNQDNNCFESDSATELQSKYIDAEQSGHHKDELDSAKAMAVTDELLHNFHEEFRLDKENNENQAAELTPEQIDYARDKYLRHVQREHNSGVFEGGLDGTVDETVSTDAGVILKEEWSAAQSELNQNHKSNFQLPLQTIKLNNDDEAAQSVSEITIHVYDILDLPIGKKVKILSEQELLNSIREKLRPHLTNAVAGLTGRMLQKKTAMLSYELQMMLNEEIPQVVEEVLDYNLENILQTVEVETE